jgi:hypothetical protein
MEKWSRVGLGKVTVSALTSWVGAVNLAAGNKTKENSMSKNHKVASREEWLAARLELLKAEKELTRRSDELARQRQELPWVRIENLK